MAHDWKIMDKHLNNDTFLFLLKCLHYIHFVLDDIGYKEYIHRNVFKEFYYTWYSINM